MLTYQERSCTVGDAFALARRLFLFVTLRHKLRAGGAGLACGSAPPVVPAGESRFTSAASIAISASASPRLRRRPLLPTCELKTAHGSTPSRTTAAAAKASSLIRRLFTQTSPLACFTQTQQRVWKIQLAVPDTAPFAGFPPPRSHETSASRIQQQEFNKHKSLRKRRDGAWGEEKALLQEGVSPPFPIPTALTIPRPSCCRAPPPTWQEHPCGGLLPGITGRTLQRRPFGAEHVAELRGRRRATKWAAPDRAGAGRLVDPDARMGPILLKPHSDTGSQIVVSDSHRTHGRPRLFKKKGIMEDRHQPPTASPPTMTSWCSGAGSQRNQPQGLTMSSTCAWPNMRGLPCCSSGTSTGAQGLRLIPQYMDDLHRRQTPPAHRISSTGSGGRLPAVRPTANTCSTVRELPCSAPFLTYRDLNIPEEDMASFSAGTPTAAKKRRGHWTSRGHAAARIQSPALRRSPPNPTSACVRCAVRRRWGDDGDASGSVVPDLDDLRRSGLADNILSQPC